MLRRLLPCLLLLLAFAPHPAAAHPHMWVNARAELNFDKDGALASVTHYWRFDEVFSAFALQGQDTNHDGKMSEQELKALADLSIESLAEYRYFTKVSRDDAELPIHPTTHRMIARDGVLTLVFTMALDKPAPSAGSPLHVEIGDPEYYIAYSFPHKPPVELKDAPQGCAADFKPPAPLDAAAAAKLAAIPADQRTLSPEMFVLTKDRMYETVVTCSGAAHAP